MGPDERAIREVQATWIDAVSAGDMTRLLPLMADDVVFLNSGRPPMNRDDFAAAFSAGHKQGRISCKSDFEEIVIVGEVAYTRTRHEVSMTPIGGGETMQYAGHALTVWRKQPDGRWVLARDANLISPVVKS